MSQTNDELKREFEKVVDLLVQIESARESISSLLKDIKDIVNQGFLHCCFFSGASIPKKRIFFPSIRIVSPSVTLAIPEIILTSSDLTSLQVNKKNIRQILVTKKRFVLFKYII